MRKYFTIFTLLVSAMLLFPFSSLFADVTVSFGDADFMYNTTNQITVTVVTDEDIQAFDLIGEVTTTVTDAYGLVTAVDMGTVPDGDSDLNQVPADCSVTDPYMVRMWGFDATNTNMQLTAAGSPYTLTLTVDVCCDTGKFVMDCTDGWIVDPDPVIATTHFVRPGATTATYTCTGGTYRVYNTPPTIDNCPGDSVFNACAVINYDFDATDPDAWCTQDLRWTKVGGSAGGSINQTDGRYSWDPPAVQGVCGMYDAVIRVTDEWGAYDECTWVITLITDAPVITYCPPPLVDGNDGISEVFIYWGWTADGTVDAVDPDSCPLPLEYTLVSFDGPTTAGPFDVNSANGDWSWPTIYGDDAYLGTWNVEVMVDDGCWDDDRDNAFCTFQVRVAPTYEVYIEKIHKQLQGHYAYVNVFLDHWTEGFGGYDLLIAYDASALTFMSATPGTILEACGFEYFTYRFGANGNCDGPCPSGFLRVVSIADMNNGANHPACFGEGMDGSLATLKFLVTNNRTYECQFVPVSFYWFDCGDNGISSISGDTLFISAHVFGYDLVGEITGVPGYGGWQGTEYDCLEGDKIFADTVVNFYNGGVDIACADSIDKRGDINLNGIANEIADAVLFSNYFLQGIIVFDVALEGQVAATDVNNDGLTLSVGDLVYLIRIITGDALPFPKLAPFSAAADIKVVNGSVSTTSSENIGGVYMTFNVNGAYTVVNHTDMEVAYAERSGVLHMLVFSGYDNMSNSLPAGSNELVTVTGAELVSVEVADFTGNLMNTRVEKTALPTQFNLSQNVPNPFNPTTKVGFDLPVVTGWSLDIYNVNGQLIESYTGTNIGHVEVTWDATSVASGIYFYKLSAGAFSDTKKMVLMK